VPQFSENSRGVAKTLLPTLPMTAQVEDLMSSKVVAIPQSSSVFDAAREMLDHDIGCVVVLDGKKVLGIATKSDVIREAVLKRLDPQKIGVESVMSKPVITISRGSTLAEASDLMSKHNISKLPVLEKGEIVGVITSTDLVRRTRPKKLAKDMI
jgi:CBS domain-containing protein